MENDKDFVITGCKYDGSIWLERVIDFPGTRYEPPSSDVEPEKCPSCNSYVDDPRYEEEFPYGAIARAALEAARCVAIGIEFIALPRCSDCGHPFYEGIIVGNSNYAYCFACYDERIEKGENQP